MSNRRRVLIGLAFVVVLAALAILLPEFASLDVLVRRETGLRESIANNPVQSSIIGFGVYFLASLIPGTGGKSMIVGWLFGLWTAALSLVARRFALGISCSPRSLVASRKRPANWFRDNFTELPVVSPRQ